MWAILLLPAAVIAAALFTQPQPPQDSSTIILLPDEDGSVGSLIVSNDSGQQALNTAYSTMQSGDSGELAAGTTSAESVAAEFGAMLNATPAAPRSFTVTFQSGSADTLTVQSQREVDTIKTYLLTLPAPEISVIGHTDRVGSIEDNDQLSRLRAESVQRYIQSTGVRTSSIEAAGRGEREPLIETPDGVAEPRNRRVEIRVR